MIIGGRGRAQVHRATLSQRRRGYVRLIAVHVLQVPIVLYGINIWRRYFATAFIIHTPALA